MKDKIALFTENSPSLESYWRSIVLFGRNVASYKFALAKSLLEIAPMGQSEITLEMLAEPFAKHICEHIRVAPKQATSNSSKFLEACTKFNNNEVTYDELISTTVALGFNNVIDAFHIVNNHELPKRFYVKDYSSNGKRIILTDEVFKMVGHSDLCNLNAEAESRWKLVETAWELGVNRNLLNVKYDNDLECLFIDERLRRKDVTSIRGALNGYQKGKCFYCFDDIVVDGDDNDCDVDHFIPHSLQKFVGDVNLDGVWNLVLSCQNCNRGSNGKFANLPSLKYLERLHNRNEFLISSHHPLRETIINQTGKTEEERIAFLNNIWNRAKEILIHTWETKNIGEEVF